MRCRVCLKLNWNNTRKVDLNLQENGKLWQYPPAVKLAIVSALWDGQHWTQAFLRVLKIFSRPAVAGAVLHTSLSFIHWATESSLSSKSSKFLHSQTVRARDLTFFRQCSPSPVCHVSHVTCHMPPEMEKRTNVPTMLV